MGLQAYLVNEGTFWAACENIIDYINVIIKRMQKGELCQKLKIILTR